ncbi:hypothetical protein EYF80_053910 [Liparis tanakae]|uniref:Uncharacterized protein n=1 Tax=Liparis tanakae TaxID=230148 RepID=A0A4Z2F453_9TELE|nr:hypothetical protein EYF80_053910 [Liparis tanakae]
MNETVCEPSSPVSVVVNPAASVLTAAFWLPCYSPSLYPVEPVILYLLVVSCARASRLVGVCVTEFKEGDARHAASFSQNLRTRYSGLAVSRGVASSKAVSTKGTFAAALENVSPPSEYRHRATYLQQEAG